MNGCWSNNSNTKGQVLLHISPLFSFYKSSCLPYSLLFTRSTLLAFYVSFHPHIPRVTSWKIKHYYCYSHGSFSANLFPKSTFDYNEFENSCWRIYASISFLRVIESSVTPSINQKDKQAPYYCCAFSK